MEENTVDRLLPWFQLRSVPGIGNLLLKRLLDRFESPEQVLTASPEQLGGGEGITTRLASAVAGQPVTDQVRRELDRVAERMQDRHFRVIPLTDPDYPGLLLQIPDPPPFLYAHGDLHRAHRNIALVGSRTATRYGIYTTRHLAGELAGLNITVVSGMARGIDTAAHEGALEKGGRTIAVLGSGLDRIYPAENRNLCRRITESGAVITEFPLNAGPDPHHFPIRNRIISGISLGTVVVEAAKRSGSLITARLAAEQNREVFAVPGNIHSFKSAGTHSLLKQGAKLVENAVDILEELPQLIGSHMAKHHVRGEEVLDIPPLSEEESLVFKALGPYPIHIDELMRKLDMNPGPLSSILLQLELKGIVAQSPGKLFSIEIKNMI